MLPAPSLIWMHRRKLWNTLELITSFMWLLRPKTALGMLNLFIVQDLISALLKTHYVEFQSAPHPFNSVRHSSCVTTLMLPYVFIFLNLISVFNVPPRQFQYSPTNIFNLNYCKSFIPILIPFEAFIVVLTLLLKINLLLDVCISYFIK